MIGRHRGGGGRDGRGGRDGATGSEPTLPLETDRAALALVLLGPGIELEIALRGRTSWAVGRAPDNDVVVDHPSISRHHARLHAGEGFALEALAATNPLRVGGRTLGPGDRVAVAPGEAFTLGVLVGVIRPAARPGGGSPAPVADAAPPRTLRDELAAEERRRIIDALRRSAGNQSRAAELLGMPRRTLVKRLREYGIPRGRIIPDGEP